MIFSGGDIDVNLNRVTWICENRKGSANKTALREFLTLLLGEFQVKIVPFCFIDKNQKPISLNKPKRTDYSNYYSDLEQIINRVK